MTIKWVHDGFGAQYAEGKHGVTGLLQILIADAQDHIRIGIYQPACLKFIHQIHHLPLFDSRSSALNTIYFIKT